MRDCRGLKSGRETRAVPVGTGSLSHSHPGLTSGANEWRPERAGMRCFRFTSSPKIEFSRTH